MGTLSFSSNKFTRNIIALSFKDSPRKPLGHRPYNDCENAITKQKCHYKAEVLISISFPQLKSLRNRLLRNEKEEKDGERQLQLHDAIKKARKYRRDYAKESSRTGGGRHPLKSATDFNPDDFEGTYRAGQKSGP